MAGDGELAAKKPKLQGETEADELSEWVRSQMESESKEQVTKFVAILRSFGFSSVDNLAQFKRRLGILDASTILENNGKGIPMMWASILLQAAENPQVGKLSALDTIRKMIDEGKFKIPEPFPFVKLKHREGPIKELESYISQSLGNKGREFGDKGKFSLLGSSGMKGIGKTVLLLHGVHKLVPENCSGIYVTLNGEGDAFETFTESYKKGSSLADAFGHVLLRFCGADKSLCREFDFDHCMQVLFGMNPSKAAGLVFFVDEIGKLDKHEPLLANRLLHDLMDKMDGANGKLVFIFTHISQKYLKKLQTDSGRKVKVFALPAFPINEWKLLEHLREAAEIHPAIHQLLLLCCGHPRSLIDGIAKAVKDNGTLLTSPSERAIITAKDKIIQECKFDDIEDEDLSTLIVQWFSIGSGFKLEALKRDGLIVTVEEMESSTDFFLPLLLDHWAIKYSRDHPLAFHLQQVYANDSVLGANAEKRMEAVMYHYESVLRLALDGRMFALSDFYNSNHIGEKFCDMDIAAKIPAGKQCVTEVQDFSDDNMGYVHERLKEGYIVVSKKHGEVGVEYLSPYEHQGQLVVACVQCKFVNTSANWSEIRHKMLTASSWLAAEGIKHFPVIYTTVDQYRVNKDTYKDGVYFIESDIFEFTKKLGVLRLHTQKLGKKMEEARPWLRRATSDPEVDA